MTIKKIIGIMSCKGGVGKSTLSVNLAVAMATFFNKSVGLLDADLYGPNHARFLGIDNKISLNLQDKKFIPFIKYGVKSMSFSYFIDSNSSVLLRGPMISNTIKYMFNNTDWGNLDILFIDFPPGTGDIYLSLLRDINFYGVFLITTPHLIAIDDVRRSIFMLKSFNIKILCLIENMKYFFCKKCMTVNSISTNNDYAKDLAKEFLIEDYYSLPFINYIGESSNSGIPFFLSESCNEDVKAIFKKIIINL